MEIINAQLEELQKELLKRVNAKKDYDEQIARRLIEKVTVYSEQFEFKSGILVDVKR